MIYQIIYASAAAHEVTSLDIDHIVSTSVQKNGPAGLTGMLLYVDGSFFQLLEGGKSVVQATFARINQDTRHEKVSMLISGEVTARVCPFWSMGYKNIDLCTDTAVLFELPERMRREGISGVRDYAVSILMEKFFQIGSGERAFA